MQDLGQKVVALNLRVNCLDKALNLPVIPYVRPYSSGYYNLLVNQVALLNRRVVRLERTIGIATNKIVPSTALLKNITMQINPLCQRIKRLEGLIL